MAAEIAGKVEVHEMAMNNGVMTMRPLDKGLTIDPGKTVKLAPGGYHLMMFGSEEPVEAGRQGAGDAQVRKGRQGAVSLDVQGVGAQAPAAVRHMEMKKMPDDRHEDVNDVI